MKVFHSIERNSVVQLIKIFSFRQKNFRPENLLFTVRNNKLRYLLNRRGTQSCQHLWYFVSRRNGCLNCLLIKYIKFITKNWHFKFLLQEDKTMHCNLWKINKKKNKKITIV